MRKITFMFIIGALMAGVAFPASAQSDDVLVEADFDDGKVPAFLSATDGWTVVKKRSETVLHGESGADELQFADIPDGSEWADYAFEARVRLIAGSFAMNVRVPNTDNFCGGYGAALLAPSDVLDLFSLDSACAYTELQVEEFEIPLNEWAVLRLEAVGPEITFYVDEEPLLSVTDDAYSSGFPALSLYADSEVDIDYLKVMALEGAAPTPGSTLEHYDAEPADAVDELFELGIIPTRGRLLFEEDYAWFEGKGNWFTALARRSPHTDVVMAGELTFRVGAPGEFERCNLSFRISANKQGQATTYIDVAIVDGGDVVVLDYSKEGEDATTFEYATLGLDLAEPHHLLIVALDDALTVYVDGQRVFDQLEVVERAGTFGIALVSQDSKSRCEGRNIWVYQLDD